ncbi:hypothetical protein QQF64_001939 [Cirrhinus molitorella]|uniref:Uncharacterized protein n=1 Tax=Cirrhinus molitorella TaxID=172907 RepID=A0ABR3MNQ7_9TELE
MLKMRTAEKPLNNRLFLRSLWTRVSNERRCNPTPSLKPVLKDPKMGMKTFLFLHRLGLIELFQQNVKEELKAVLLIAESTMVLQSDWPERELLLTSQLPKHRRISNNVGNGLRNVLQVQDKN